MNNALIFTHLSDGTVLERQGDGTYHPIAVKTHTGRLKNLTEEDIEQLSSSDPDHPGLDDQFWLEVDQTNNTLNISVDLDSSLVAFFRKQGCNYRDRINAVLRQYVDLQKISR